MRAAWMILFLLAAGTVAATDAPAHCDTMDGPVIQAAQKALDAGDVNLVLVWVQKKDEEAIREAFNRTLEVRKLSTASKNWRTCTFSKRWCASTGPARGSLTWESSPPGRTPEPP